MNSGRNYDQNHDGYAYVYSPDSEDAYHVADQFVLARVPVGRLRDRAAYEFFLGTNTTEAAAWTTDVTSRRGVLERPVACYRPGITYDAAIDRFLLVNPRPNIHSHDAAGRIDTRFQGGLSIYEAPQPWGPWSIVFDADEWDIAPGDSASFPAKWISRDGLTLHMVFSGEDTFSVRRVDLIPAKFN